MPEEYRKWFEAFIQQAEEELCSRLAAEQRRFLSWGQIVSRFRESASRLLERGLDALNQFREAHNELCVAVKILDDKNICTRLDYEPPMENCQQRFDFYVTMTEKRPCWVEVKTIHPASQDDWEKYKNIIEKGRIPDNVQVVYEEEWLGGELWHYAYTSRSKMLEYSLSVEEKIQSCQINRDKEMCMVVFCGDGFRWDLDALEDFVSFYRTGKHWPGDPFQDMEKHYIEQNGIALLRNIDHFAFFRRREIELHPDKIVWSVQPARWPW